MVKPSALLLWLLAAFPAQAAQLWGIAHEKPVVVAGEVVDLLCALTGDCPADCGAGRRQLGILTPQGRLVPAVKGDVFFAGAVQDLLPWCRRKVMADGLLIENPKATLFFVQNVRGSSREKWKPAKAFLDWWRAHYGDGQRWWEDDPRVKAELERSGVFGIPGLAPE